jgi:Ca2+-binding RTX toxin-like protein
LSGGGGNDTLNGGAGNDLLRGGAGNDVYVVSSALDVVDESVAGSGGADTVQSYVSASLSQTSTFKGQVENVVLMGTANLNGNGNALHNAITGNSGANVLYGFDGNDTLVGNAGNDILVGGNGNDVLRGGTGIDKMTGSAGNDVFVFDTTPNASTNLDSITDFNVAADTIRLENAIFTAVGAAGTLAASAFHIGAAAADAADRIIYNSSTGALTYDSNGSAAGGSIHFATLLKGLALTNADFQII